MCSRLPSMLIAVLAPLAIAACGEKQEDTTPTTSAALTKQEFVAEANKICEQTTGKIDRASSKFFADAPAGKEAPPDEVAQFARRTAFPAIESGISRIRALGAAVGDEDEVEALLDAAEQDLGKLEQDPAEVAPGAPGPALARFDELAGAYGLDKCAEA